MSNFFDDLKKAYKLLDTLDDQTQLKIVQHLEGNKKMYNYKERRSFIAKHVYRKEFRKTIELLQQASRGMNVKAEGKDQSH